MKTNLEQVAVLTYLECCYSELAGEVATKLGKYKLCKLANQLRDMKLARAFLYRINEYYTIESDVTLATLVSIERPNNEDITITIDIDGTPYSYSGTGTLQEIIADFKHTFLGVGIDFTQVSDQSFAIYSFNDIYSSATVTCTLTPSTPTQENEVQCVDYSDEIVDWLLNTYNCLTRPEICGVINEACCLLEKYCK